MEIKQIVEKLQTRFEGVSSVVLEKIAKKLAKTITDEESLNTAVEGVTIQQVIDSYTDARVTEGIAAHDKKTKGDGGQGAPDPKPSNNPDPAPAPSDMPEWAKGLFDKLNNQAELIKTLQQDKIQNGRNAKITEALKNLPASVRARYEKDLSRLSFKDDEDFNSWLEEAKGDFSSMENQLKQDGVKFKAPLGGGGNNPQKATEAQKEMAKNIASNLIKNK